MNMTPDEKDAEFARRHLAQQFYNALKVSSENGRIVFDFRGIPQVYSIQMPSIYGFMNEVKPPVVNALDLFRDFLPGLWGYAENAGMKSQEVCTRCHKRFPAQQQNP